MTKKSIEDFFKDTFENFEADVKPTVWNNIQTGLKGISIGLLVKLAINKIGTNTFIAIVTSVVAVVSTVVVVNWGGHSNNSKPKPIANNIEIKQPTSDIKQPDSNTASDKNVVTNSIDAKGQKMEETKVVVAPFAKRLNSNASNNPVNNVRHSSGAPIASIFANPTKGTVPLIVHFSNTGVGKINKWIYGDGKKEDRAANPTHVFEDPGHYKVALLSTDGNGKLNSDTIEIDALKNPNMSSIPVEITPNNDGDRDVWPFSNSGIVKMNVQIFEKATGKKVFEREGSSFDWDGKNNSGDDLKDGVYFYYVTGIGIKDRKSYEKKGYIQIKR